jgi:diadenosine tetraphosphate (Ap4A) HIT family hydrolase
MACAFCELKSSKIVLSNEHFIAIKDAHPVQPGHLLIVSRRHAENVFTLSPLEFSQLYDLLHQVKVYLDGKHKPDGYNIGTNCGSCAGQSIPHFHLHFIPRYKTEETPGLFRQGVKKLREHYLS